MANKELKYLFKHSSVYGIGTVIAQAAGFLLLPFYTNYLTPKDYGIAALVETTINLIGVLASMGISFAIARFYSEMDEEKDKNLIISTSYVLMWLICLVCIPVLCFVSGPLSELVFQTSNYGKYFMLSSAALFVGLSVEVGTTYLVLKARSANYVFVSLANTITLIALNIYFIAFKKIGLIGIFYSALITKVFFAVLLTILILTRVKLRFSLSTGIKMVRFSIPLGFSTVFRIATEQSDKFIINYFFSPVETGIYAIAGKIANAVHTLITTTFLRSYLSIRFEINKDPNGQRIYGAIFEQYLLVIGSFGLIIAMYSKEIIILMTSKVFYSAAYYIPPLILTWIFFGMKYHLENGMLISMKTRYITYITGGVSLVNVGLNFMLIHSLGLWGAVLSSNISNMLLTGASFFMSQRLYKIHIEWDRIFKLSICLILCFALSYFAAGLKLGMSIFVKSMLIIAYCGGIFAFRIIEPDILLSLKKSGDKPEGDPNVIVSDS